MLNEPLHNDAGYSKDVSIDVQVGGENPFPGLRAFSIDDSHLFFGRDGQIDDILLKIARNRFVTVMGYSGSGKSSLLRAGLAKGLRERPVAGLAGRVRCYMRADGQPHAGLRKSLFARLYSAPRSVIELSERDQRTLRDVLERIMSSSAPGAIGSGM